MRSAIWVIVLAVGDGHDAGHSATTPASLSEQLNRAAALAPRGRICAVVTQEQRRTLGAPLWILPRSNVLARPDKIGTAHGILLALLRISERDPHARIVLLPSNQHANDEGSFLDSLRNAAAESANKPENVILLSVERDAADASIVVGRARGLLNLFEPEMVAAMRATRERVADAHAALIATEALLERLRLPYLDFHRHVLPGQTHRRGLHMLPLSEAESI